MEVYPTKAGNGFSNLRIEAYLGYTRLETHSSWLAGGSVARLVFGVINKAAV